MSRGLRRPWSLQTRLVLGIVLLLAVISVAVGAISTATLGNVLTARLDDQVRSAFDTLAGPAGPDEPPPGYQPSPRDVLRRGALVLLTTNGEVSVATFLAEYETEALTEDQQAALLALADERQPTSVQLGGELGEYRVIAETRGSERLIVGLPLAEVRATTAQLLLIIALVTLMAVAAAAVAGVAVVRVALRPLGRVAATAARVSELPLDRGEVTLAERVPAADTDERTEVGQVGAAINRMLGHVASALSAREASERKVRQFVADASHELRTPLASIRGYAELTRRGGHTLPPDVVHSMGRVESEAIRMTSLVEDLLLLARLDEGRDLEHRPVDLSRLLVDVVADAHAAAPTHGFSIDLPDEPVTVVGDDGRLRQVFANLLANARVHTPAGTNVSVGLTANQNAVVTVRDDGPGIPESTLPTIFERFARADDSRSRHSGSTGLGLAIVQAVVSGHDGTVTVSSRPGDTVFTVTLPVVRQGELPTPPSGPPGARLYPVRSTEGAT